MRVRTILSLVVLLICTSFCNAQLKNSYGKAWRISDENASDIIQLSVENVVWARGSGTMSGTLSVKVNDEWQTPNAKQFTGTVNKIGEYIHFEGECIDGIRFRGWYTQGNSDFDRTDDRVMVIAYNLQSLHDTDPCDPVDAMNGEEDQINEY